MRKDTIILGNGPSGLIMGSLLKNASKDFSIFTKGESNFSHKETMGVKFTQGQRTLFCDKAILEFSSNIFNEEMKFEDTSDKISVHYKESDYQYPIQNANDIPISMKLKMYLSYLLRDKKLLKDGNYVSWVEGTYGKFLAREIILPHTWKTIKEDLWTISALDYGKKVLPFKLFGKKEPVYKICDGDAGKLFDLMKDVCYDNTSCDSIDSININDRFIVSKSGNRNDYHIIVNSIPLPFLLDLIVDKPPIIDAAHRSLNYNDMLSVTMIVPSVFIKSLKEIIYFPEREFIFSKINIAKGLDCNYSAITSEISFRMNEKKKLGSTAFINKIYERVENDLKKAGIIPSNLFIAMEQVHNLISPAYIIYDFETNMYNQLIQTWLENNNIYNIGRFSQWRPDMRVEHSIKRAYQIMGMNIYGL